MLRSVLTEAGRRPIHEAIDRFANDYAHEMAEAIRNHEFHPGAEPYDAADLIDPEVES